MSREDIILRHIKSLPKEETNSYLEVLKEANKELHESVLTKMREMKKEKNGLTLLGRN